MTENVVVICRLRPILEKDACKSLCMAAVSDRQVCIGASRLFSVDSVANFDISTKELYQRRAQQLESSFVEGYNATLLAYGQTGSGKTHTIGGMVPIFLEQVSHRLSLDTLSFSYIEVYGDVIHDLLATTDRHKSLQLFENGTGVVIASAIRARAKNWEEVEWLLRQGEKNRKTAETDFNAFSSRSHSILIIHNAGKKNKMHFVDLAGSERQKKAQSAGVRFKESIAINTGLLALGNVIRALAQGKQHIPYRGSKLTRLLQDSLGGNSRTLFIGCVAPNKANMDETTRTLQYCCRAMHILNEPLPIMDRLIAQQERHLHPSHSNTGEDERQDEIAHLNQVIQRLRQELSGAKLDLSKDEAIFAQKLSEIAALREENILLRKHVEELEETPTQKADSQSKGATPDYFPPDGDPSPCSGGPSPFHLLHFQNSNIAKKYEVDCDYVQPYHHSVNDEVQPIHSVHNTPSKRLDFSSQCSSTCEDQHYSTLRDPHKCVKFYKYQSETLKDEVEHLLRTNETLKQENNSLNSELQEIRSLLCEY